MNQVPNSARWQIFLRDPNNVEIELNFESKNETDELTVGGHFFVSLWLVFSPLVPAVARSRMRKITLCPSNVPKSRDGTYPARACA